VRVAGDSCISGMLPFSYQQGLGCQLPTPNDASIELPLKCVRNIWCGVHIACNIFRII
jgi:hypothetical protein